MVSDYPDLLTLTYWSSGQQQETKSTKENQSKNWSSHVHWLILCISKKLQTFDIQIAQLIQATGGSLYSLLHLYLYSLCICIWYFVFADQNCSTYSSIWRVFVFTSVFVLVFSLVFLVDTYLMFRIAELIQASGAGGGKNVKNASLWDRSNAMDSYCRITHENNMLQINWFKAVLLL